MSDELNKLKEIKREVEIGNKFNFMIVEELRKINRNLELLNKKEAPK